MLRGWLVLSLGTIWQGGSCELNYRCCQCSRLSLDQHCHLLKSLTSSSFYLEHMVHAYRVFVTLTYLYS